MVSGISKLAAASPEPTICCTSCSLAASLLGPPCAYSDSAYRPLGPSWEKKAAM